MEPLRNRVFFAGEAVHETAWGTVGGAWESGTRAADAVVRRVLGQPEPAPPKTGKRAAGEAGAARKKEVVARYRASCSFSQPTMVLAISSGCCPGVRPM